MLFNIRQNNSKAEKYVNIVVEIGDHKMMSSKAQKEKQSITIKIYLIIQITKY